GIVDSIPAFITDGLNYAMGIIPAIGFAMLARMIMSKKLACFLFMGFLVVAYGGLNVVGVTAVAAVIAAVLVFNTGLFSTVQAEAEQDDNEF
uniref:PTS sugar transporter subunit IIC n=1 Tax=uncultured Enorma sp. TaxID=1714346 RepID=UPI002804690A